MVPLLAVVPFVVGIVLSMRGFLGMEDGPFWSAGGPPLPGGPPSEPHTAFEVPEGHLPLLFAVAGWILGGASLAPWGRERTRLVLGLSGGIALLAVGLVLSLSWFLPDFCLADAPCWGGSAWAAARGLALSGFSVLVVNPVLAPAKATLSPAL